MIQKFSLTNIKVHISRGIRDGQEIVSALQVLIVYRDNVLKKFLWKVGWERCYNTIEFYPLGVVFSFE